MWFPLERFCFRVNQWFSFFFFLLCVEFNRNHLKCLLAVAGGWKGAKDTIFCTLPYIYRSTTSISETCNRVICVDFVELDLFTLPLRPSSWGHFQESAIKHFDPNNYSSTFLTKEWGYKLRGKSKRSYASLRTCICLNIYSNGKNHWRTRVNTEKKPWHT